MGEWRQNEAVNAAMHTDGRKNYWAIGKYAYRERNLGLMQKMCVKRE